MADDGDDGALAGFEPSARHAVELAEVEARRLGHDRVGTEHLLLGLLAEATPAATALVDAGVTLTAARHKVGEAVGRIALGSTEPDRPLTRTARAGRALGRAMRFAHARHSDGVGTEHVLLGVLDVEGTAGQVLRGLGVDVERLRMTLDDLADAEVGDERAPRRRDSGRSRRAAVAVACPSCGSALDGLVARTLTAEGDAGPRDVVVYGCGSCGSALAVTEI